MAERERVTLKDVMNYAPEEHLSKEEVDLIHRTFKGNEALINVLRKIFIPTLNDPKLPVEEFGKDPFLMDTDFRQIPEHELKSVMVGRQDAIKLVFGGLIKLKIIANQKVLTDEELAEIQKKDSTQ